MCVCDRKKKKKNKRTKKKVRRNERNEDFFGHPDHGNAFHVERDIVWRHSLET